MDIQDVKCTIYLEPKLLWKYLTDENMAECVNLLPIGVLGNILKLLKKSATVSLTVLSYTTAFCILEL
jgi:hypothetical protein